MEVIMLRRNWFIKILALSILLTLATANLFPDDQQTTINNTMVQQKLVRKFNADLKVVAIMNSPCLCENDMKRYFDTIAPKNLTVYLHNDSAVSINVKLTVKYFSLSRVPNSWNTIVRNFSMTANQARSEVIWANTYYDIIRAKNPVFLVARADITNTNITDTNLANNVYKTDKCEVYVY
jgi:hypothetical protein